ncbi:hypothetical protein FJZ19_04830 [Candidatus Pacearchaeota archaeon]|nr:hypothetical protein [Candidatus Pacearchaeota archaeon]
MRKSRNRALNVIEDFYIQLGYRGHKLRRALENDKEYQKIIKNKKKALTKKLNISKKEKERYVLSTDKDYEILEKCKILLNKKLFREDKEIVKLIRTQLKDDWRTDLIKELNKLLKKHKI